jgi:hypothetical protein
MADRTPGRQVRNSLILVALALVATGCSVRAPGEALAQTSPPSSADRYGAPQVASPLNATTFLAKPCTTLTPAQLENLRLPGPGTPDTNSAVAGYAGPSCGWKDSLQGNYTEVVFLTGNPNGLADVYRGRSTGQFDGYWVETTVDGYPGVFKGFAGADRRKDGSCELDIGISDTLEFLVMEQDRLAEKSCDRALLIASMVITTVRAGG